MLSKRASTFRSDAFFLLCAGKNLSKKNKRLLQKQRTRSPRIFVACRARFRKLKGNRIGARRKLRVVERQTFAPAETLSRSLAVTDREVQTSSDKWKLCNLQNVKEAQIT